MRKMSVDSKSDQNDSRELLRKMLLQLQDETYRRVREFRRDQEQESESGPADEMDSARATAEVETHAGLIARAEEKLRFLDEALTRLDAGKYGRCVGCHELIPLERLKALPFAAYCVDCQQKRNRVRSGWAEGTMIPPYDHQWTVPEEMEEPGEREYRSTDPEEQLTIDRGAIGSGEPESPARSILSPKKQKRRSRRHKK
jgi:RNA polymerase-binding transcription factor